MIIFPTTHTYIRYSIADGEFNMPTAWLENFTWSGRDAYLSWVTEWKACLHQKIAAIRHAKTIRRDRGVSIEDRNAANAERQQLRIDCFNLLLLRQFGRRESAKQRQRALAG